MLICLKFICIFKYVISSNGHKKRGRAVQEKLNKIGGATFSCSKFFGVPKKVISKKIYYFRGTTF